MNIIFAEDFDVDLPFDYKEVCERTVKEVLSFLDFPMEAEISVTITDDEVIKAMNKEYRDIDSPTDVLSFPLIQFDLTKPYKECVFTADDKDPDTGDICLGDIVLNLNRIKSQAEEYGHSLEREYSFLICHSMLHLLGYDHIKDDDREKMEEAQKQVMERLGISR